jgi:cyclopropane-fatty-acyl-phospholipid synthase
VSTAEDIRVSYDLPSSFYACFLDRNMSYTCALFEGTDDLEAAQGKKLAFLFDSARIEPGMRVLDIGCGWGANLAFLAERGVREPHGITLSPSQYRYCVERRIPRAAVEHVSYLHYRPEKPFDAIESIGMIEHVATPEQAFTKQSVEVYRDYFARAHAWSRRGARFSLQSILRDRVPRDPKDLREMAWLGKTIMPGAISPRMEELVEAASACWEIELVVTRRDHYRRTAGAWRSRLLAAERRVRAEFGDAVFTDYARYLGVLENAFVQGYMTLVQIILLRR